MSKNVKSAERQRMWVYLDPETQTRLEEVARKELRRPHDQAALLLRDVLAAKREPVEA